jgi:signal transduction histidine kinase/ActR/RegA family two-component response regulator
VAVYANQTALALLGMPPKRLLGRVPLGRDWRVQREDGSDLPESEQPALVALRNGKPVRDFVVSATQPDGRRVWLRIDATPTADGSQVVSTLQDVTALKESERQTKALVELENLRTLGSMASGIAHDLNQYLTLISGHGELALTSLQALRLEDGIEETDEMQAARASLAIAIRAASDGSEVLKRLQRFGRPHQDDPTEVVQLGDLLREAARLTAPKWRDVPQSEGRTIRLYVEVAGDTAVEGQPSSLRELFTNLIFNAVDAMPDGGSITLTARREGSRVMADVTDTGIGMSPQTKERVFEPFFTTKGARGTGLGLATVASITHQYGGEVSITSGPGLGTTIHLGFAAAPERSQTEAAGSARPAGPAEEDAGPPLLRVLAVDDEPELAEMIRFALKAARAHVTIATSGEGALEALAEDRFDIVVSDLSLGEGIDGWQLADRVRLRSPSTPFVLVTGWAAGLDAEDARRAGVDAILPKPFAFADLRRIVTALVDAPAGSNGPRHTRRRVRP